MCPYVPHNQFPDSEDVGCSSETHTARGSEKTSAWMCIIRSPPAAYSMTKHTCSCVWKHANRLTRNGWRTLFTVSKILFSHIRLRKRRGRRWVSCFYSSTCTSDCHSKKQCEQKLEMFTCPPHLEPQCLLSSELWWRTFLLCFCILLTTPAEGRPRTDTL